MAFLRRWGISMIKGKTKNNGRFYLYEIFQVRLFDYNILKKLSFILSCYLLFYSRIHCLDLSLKIKAISSLFCFKISKIL